MVVLRLRLRVILRLKGLRLGEVGNTEAVVVEEDNAEAVGEENLVEILIPRMLEEEGELRCPGAALWRTICGNDLISFIFISSSWRSINYFSRRLL